jgi:Metallopeptidase family M24
MKFRMRGLCASEDTAVTKIVHPAPEVEHFDQWNRIPHIAAKCEVQVSYCACQIAPTVFLARNQFLGCESGCPVAVQGYHGDTSSMFYVGSVSEAAQRLCNATKEALEASIAECGPGVPFKRIGHAIHAVADKYRCVSPLELFAKAVRRGALSEHFFAKAFRRMAPGPRGGCFAGLLVHRCPWCPYVCGAVF